ncbi:MAG: SWIM zinc finger family protein, partial [Planctomycetota bacterium]
VEGLAPDAASLKNGRKLAGQTAKWSGRGRSATALWGEFQGSGKTPYQTRIDLTGPAWKCTCPSRKQPCKHALALLIGAAGDAGFCPEGEPPDWVEEWLSKRAATAQAKATKAAAAASKPVDPNARAKRQAAREKKIAAGLDRLELWLDDRLRGGLAEFEADGFRLFEQEAARLVDAQAGGLAARLRTLAEIPGSGPDWPDRLLAGFASLRLLTAAYRNQGELSDGLREDVRTLIGWNRTEKDALADGERVEDVWATLGTIEWDEDRVRGRRTWLRGVSTGRTAEIVQFLPHAGAGGRSFEAFVDGAAQPMTLAFHPSAAPRRAVVVSRESEPVPIPLPPGRSIAGLLEEVADELAACPFRTRFAGLLTGVTPTVQGEDWRLRDDAGAGLRLARGDWWALLAESGGRPLTIAGEYATDAPGSPQFRPLRWDAGLPKAPTVGVPAAGAKR